MPNDLPDDEFRSGRHRAGAAPGRPRPAYRRPFLARVLRVPDRWSSRGRMSRPKSRAAARPVRRAERSGRHTRPVAAAVLLAALTSAWLVAGHRARAAGSSAALPSASAVPPTATAPANVPGECPRASSVQGDAHCVLDGVTLEIRRYAPGTAAAAYRRATGVTETPHEGPPACERGVPDERAWADGAAPGVAVGRYRCTIENGRAVMWWTRGDRLAHAVAANGDLAALFAWWRVHPTE